MNNVIQALVVDDEKHIRLAVSRVIGRMGCVVQEAEDGEKALNIIRQQDVQLVFLDLKMPGLDGLEVQKRIRELDESILVIIITGYATLETAIEAMKHGAYDFIPKPFSVDQLRVITKRALDWIEMSRERKRLAEEKHRTLFDLATEKSRIKTIVESLPNGVLVTNRDGLVVLMNKAARNYLGLEKILEMGQPLEHYVQNQELCAFIASQQNVLPQKGQPPDFDFQNAQGKYLLVKVRSIVGEAGEYLGVVVILVDVTAIKKLDQLKSEFVAKVSHELRSPLATIHEQMAFVIQDMLEHKPSDLDQEILSRAKDKTRGLLSLVEDLLDLSKLEAGLAYQDVQMVAVDDLLSKHCAFLLSQAKEKGQALELSVDSDLPPVHADPKALESVFSNLITNAIKYTPEGGKIRVRARSDGKKVLVEVQDTGFGIDPKDQKRIFERFYRVKDEKTRFITGTGLGLAIVKGILDDLGGEISMKSAPGQGSTFIVSLTAHH